MKQTIVTKATLGRLPLYLQYLKSPSGRENDRVSATTIAKALGLGEVQVRKDLSAVSGAGKPKIGYATAALVKKLESFLGYQKQGRAVIVGAGKLGRALLDYDGFRNYGLEIVAAFDLNAPPLHENHEKKPIFPMDQFAAFCQRENIRIGVITVPESEAQKVCDMMINEGILAIWNFAPVLLAVPNGIFLQQENLALSLAHLNLLMNQNEAMES